MSYFSAPRNVELSTLKYIQDSLNASWTGITVVKAYANIDKISPPVVSVYLSTTNTSRSEIGSRRMWDVYNIIVEVFATSDGQRLDLASFIKTKLEDDWTYYTHEQASGDPKTLVLTSAGKIVFQNFTQNSKINFGGTVAFGDRYRHIIAVDVMIAET